MEITSTQFHDAHTPKYDEGYQHPIMRIYDAITWKYLQDFLPPDKDRARILDAGGGTALWTIKLAQLGYRMTLTDISTGMLKVAEEKIRRAGVQEKVTILISDITDMKEFPDNHFDLSLAEGDPVSYCHDPERAVAELSRVTRPGGHVTVSVDNKLGWVTRYTLVKDFAKADRALREGIGMMPGDKPDEFYPAHLFTIEELQELFRRHGLEPVRTAGKPVLSFTRESLDDPAIFPRAM